MIHGVNSVFAYKTLHVFAVTLTTESLNVWYSLSILRYEHQQSDSDLLNSNDVDI
jgi:hypothetical protein